MSDKNKEDNELFLKKCESIGLDVKLVLIGDRIKVRDKLKRKVNFAVVQGMMMSAANNSLLGVLDVLFEKINDTPDYNYFWPIKFNIFELALEKNDLSLMKYLIADQDFLLNVFSESNKIKNNFFEKCKSVEMADLLWPLLGRLLSASNARLIPGWITKKTNQDTWMGWLEEKGFDKKWLLNQSMVLNESPTRRDTVDSIVELLKCPNASKLIKRVMTVWMGDCPLLAQELERIAKIFKRPTKAMVSNSDVVPWLLDKGVSTKYFSDSASYEIRAVLADWEKEKLEKIFTTDTKSAPKPRL